MNFYFIDKDNNENINWLVVSGLGALMCIVSFSIIAIGTFATLSYQQMGTFVNASSNSQQFRSLQIQLLNSLVGQALIPALLMQAPACIIFTAPFFHQGDVVPGGLIGVTISLYPVLDPLPTMFIIKHYRKAILLNMADMSDIQQTIQIVCTPLAFFTNIVLIVLIYFKSPKSLGVYKYLMIYISLFEMFYAVLDAVSVPDFYSHNTMFIVIAREDWMHFPRWGLSQMNVLFCSMFGVSLAIFAIHFIYRYMVVSGNSFICNTTPFKMSIWLLSPWSYGVLWGALLSLVLNPNKFSDAILTENYLPIHNISLQNLAYVGANYYQTDEFGKEVMNWTVMTGMGAIMVIVGSSISAMMLFAALSYRKMNNLVETSSNSQQYRALQLQLLNSLVCQALIPMFLMQSPASFVFLAPLFHAGDLFPGEILGICISFYPVLDPLPTMFIIREYRNALCKPFRGKKQQDIRRSTLS